MHEAARIIRADGTEGIVSASRIVGRQVAMGMLVLFLREQHNERGAWPDKSDTTDAVDRTLAEVLNPGERDSGVIL
jgi:hypothetical protein